MAYQQRFLPCHPSAKGLSYITLSNVVNPVTLSASQGFLPHADPSEVDDDCVAYLFSLNVLEHIEDDTGALADLYRVLEPCGRLFIYVPAFNLLYTSMDSPVGHYRRYRMADLAKFLEQNGFSVDKKAYTDALGFFATLACKLVDNRQPAPLNRRLVRLYDRYLFPSVRFCLYRLQKY